MENNSKIALEHIEWIRIAVLQWDYNDNDIKLLIYLFSRTKVRHSRRKV